MKNKIKLAAYIALMTVIIVLSVLIMGMLRDMSDAVIQEKAEELVEQLDSPDDDSEISSVAEDIRQDSLVSGSGNINDRDPGLPAPADESIAEFYQTRDRAKGYAEERQKTLIENSIFENAVLEKHKYALTDQIEGFVKEIYTEHGEPMHAKFDFTNGYDSAVITMEDGYILQLRVITVSEGVFDFEEE